MLHRIHPDCEIIFTNEQILSKNLVLTAQQEAIRYLQNNKSDSHIKEIINKIEKDRTIEPIFDKIKPKISELMLESFNLFFHSSKNPNFNALIDNARYVALSHMNEFQEMISDSQGESIGTLVQACNLYTISESIITESPPMIEKGAPATFNTFQSH